MGFLCFRFLQFVFKVGYFELEILKFFGSRTFPRLGGRGGSIVKPQPADGQQGKYQEDRSPFNKMHRRDSRMNDFRGVHAVQRKNVGLDVGDLQLGD